MELFEEAERLKLRFLMAFRRLQERGYLQEADLEEVIEALDRLDEMSDEEFEATIGRLRSMLPRA